MDLHSDAIFLAHEGDSSQQERKVRFEPFVGIGPRRFLDLFSMNLSRGKEKRRKRDGKIIRWDRSTACIKVPLSPISYIDRETLVLQEMTELTGGRNGHQDMDR